MQCGVGDGATAYANKAANGESLLKVARISPFLAGWAAVEAELAFFFAETRRFWRHV